MKFYHIKNQYIEFLRKFDARVPDNKNEQRPYIGIVLEIGDMKYYTPLSSPKPKHKRMKNSKDFRKINHGILGAINFNNMLPVVDSALILIEIDKLENVQYQNLLKNQYKYIKEDEEQIKKTAQKLHKLIFTSNTVLSPYDLEVKQRCCNLPILEEHMKEYKENNI